MRSAVGGLIATHRFGVQVLERAWFDAAVVNERINLGLLEPDHAAEPVRGQLTLIDQAIERSRSEAERGRGFLCGQPVSIGVRHEFETSTVSHLSTSFDVPHTAGRAHHA